MPLHFVDGNPIRAALVQRIAPGLAPSLAGLPAGYSTSAPDPAQRARDMVLAVDDLFPCFAEATDLTTVDGKSLRLELDSENDNRFCRWWRETPVRLHLCVALRRDRSGEVELFAGELAGHIADRPAGPRPLGWDRLFVPDGADRTLAELVDDQASPPSSLHADVYGRLGHAVEAGS